MQMILPNGRGLMVIWLFFSILAAVWWVLHERKSKYLKGETGKLTTGPLTLASILVGLGVLCLKFAIEQSSKASLDYNTTAFIGFLAVSAGALLVDSVMDQHLELTLKQRLVFLNGGYLVFCVVMTAVAFALVADALGGKANILEVNRIEPYLVAMALLFKVMTKNEDKGIALLALLLTSIYAWAAVWGTAPRANSYKLYLALTTIVVFAIISKWKDNRCCNNQIPEDENNSITITKIIINKNASIESVVENIAKSVYKASVSNPTAREMNVKLLLSPKGLKDEYGYLIPNKTDLYMGCIQLDRADLKEIRKYKSVSKYICNTENTNLFLKQVKQMEYVNYLDSMHGSEVEE